MVSAVFVVLELLSHATCKRHLILADTPSGWCLVFQSLQLVQLLLKD